MDEIVLRFCASNAENTSSASNRPPQICAVVVGVVALAIGCGKQPQRPGVEAAREPLIEQPQPDGRPQATVRAFDVVKLRDVPAGSWKATKLGKARTMLDGTQTVPWKVLPVPRRSDRVLLMRAGQTRLYDDMGEELQRWDAALQVLSGEWAEVVTGTRPLTAANLTTGKTQQITVTNESAIETELGRDFHASLFATGSILWWKSSGGDDEPTWIARVGDGPAEASALTFPAVPVAFGGPWGQGLSKVDASQWHDDQLLLRAVKGCGLIAYRPDETSHCLFDEGGGGFAVVDGRVFALHQVLDFYVELPDIRRQLQTPCSKFAVSGLHEESGYAYYTCDDGWGIYGPDNDFVHAAKNEPLGLRWVSEVRHPLPRFLHVAKTRDEQAPTHMVVDMRTTELLTLEGTLLAMGLDTAMLRRGESLVLADFAQRTTEAFAERPCGEGKQTHLTVRHAGADRYQLICAEVDARKLKERKLTIRSMRESVVFKRNELIDVPRRMTFPLVGEVRGSTAGAVLVEQLSPEPKTVTLEAYALPQ